MLNLKASFWFKVTALFLMVVLLVPVLIACGNGDNKTTPLVTTTPNITTTSTPSPTTTPNVTPTSNIGPVKIGAIYARSGSMGVMAVLIDPIVSLLEDMVKKQGGILGGREVKFIVSDDSGSVAQASALAKKLIMEDNVTMLTFGGESGAQFDAVSDVAEELKVPYVAIGGVSEMAKRKYTVQTTGWKSFQDTFMAHVEFLNPKKIAVLIYDLADGHQMMDGLEGVKGLRDRFKTAGIDLVYEQYYPSDTADFSPYITKIKYLNPDVLFFSTNTVAQVVTIQKQFSELGGYGNIKFYNCTGQGTSPAVIMKSASVGTYAAAGWIAGSDDPGMKTFEDAYRQKYGKLPDAASASGYNCFLTAIKAIEMAGTDNRDKINQALHSGKLELDTAWGHLIMGTNGDGDIARELVLVQDKNKLLKVWPPTSTPSQTTTPEITTAPTATATPNPTTIAPTAAPTTAAPTTAPTGTAAPTAAIHTGLDINSNIGDLVDNQYTSAVLEKWVPGLTSNPQLMGAYGMTLPDIAPMKPDMFTAEVMAGIEKDLAAIK